ncbi:MAG: peptide chain release factor N(5)-glutamine methyltransferase, partial [Cyanobacteria bacterium]|nr:peptide chain release factor N(5)-glutamine methyltransferase [Cyanobacteriota bacterium]
MAQAEQAGIDQADVDWLLRAVTELDSLSLRLGTFQHYDAIAVQRSLPELTQLWQQRLEQRIPVQYLAGIVHWREFTLRVSPAVLIPRPETELIVDLAIEQNSQAASDDPGAMLDQPEMMACHWVDLGTGSGAIAIGLATAFPQAIVHAVDCSAEALTIARANIQAYQLSERIQLYHGSWFAPITHLKGQVSGLVANPPYIPTALIPELQPEVVGHEPRIALDGGDDGLDCLRHLVEAAPDYLCSGGIWLVETMMGQANDVMGLLQAQGNYENIQIRPDLAGIDRFVLAR